VLREVFAAQYRDRIVHHLFCMRLNKFIEEMVIEDSYSCRKGKGTLYGTHRFSLKLIENTNYYKKEVFIVRGDLSGFFISIDKRIMFNKIEQIIRSNYEGDNYEYMIWLLNKILFNAPQFSFIRKTPIEKWNLIPKHKLLLYCDENHGLPVGNLPSQVWTTIYMTQFDKDTEAFPGVLGYGRYVDDFYVIFETKEECENYLKWAEPELSKLNLTLNMKKTKVISSNNPIEFIGMVFDKGHKYITDRTKQTLYKTFDYLSQLEIKSIDDLKNKVIPKLNASFGYLSHFTEYKLQKDLVSSEQFKKYVGLLKFDVKLTWFRPLRKTDYLTELQVDLMRKNGFFDCKEDDK
jgi:hypothetical protein